MFSPKRYALKIRNLTHKLYLCFFNKVISITLNFRQAITALSHATILVFYSNYYYKKKICCIFFLQLLRRICKNSLFLKSGARQNKKQSLVAALLLVLLLLSQRQYVFFKTRRRNIQLFRKLLCFSHFYDIFKVLGSNVESVLA